MLDPTTLLTIALMAATTYMTRVVGYVALRNRTLSPRLHRAMQNVPGCVLISVIAPAFVSDRPADLVALAVTLFAATRWSILPTVLFGITATGLLRHVLG